MRRVARGIARWFDVAPEAAAPLVRCAVLCFVWYAAVAGAHAYSLDGVLMYHQAVELVRNRDLTFDHPITWAGVTHHASFYGIGMSLALVPAITLWSPFLRFVYYPRGTDDLGLLNADPLYVLVLQTTNPTITALTAALVGLVALRLTRSRRVAVVAALVYGLASPAAAYARMDWSQPLATLLLFGAVAAVALAPAERLRGAAVAAGACLGFAVMTRPEFLVFSGPVGLLLLGRGWWEARQALPWLVVAFGVPFAAGCALYGWTNWLRFGSPVVAGPYSIQGMRGEVLRGFFGLLIAPAVGIVWYAPLVALVPAGVRHLWTTADASARRLAVVAGVESVLFLLVYSWWGIWWGGLSWGPRFLAPLVPFVVLFGIVGGWRWAAGGAELGPARRLVGLVAVMALATSTGVIANPLVAGKELPGFNPWRSPLLNAWIELRDQPQNALDIVWLKDVPASSGVSLLPFAGLLYACYRLARPLRREILAGLTAEPADTPAGPPLATPAQPRRDRPERRAAAARRR